MALNVGHRLARHAGVNQYGNYYVSTLSEGALDGTGARSDRDGDDTGDGLSSHNIEWVEANFPLLYLFRRNTRGGGGAGKFRGGAGSESALTVHALEIPRLAHDYGITSFKYQLHLMQPERTATYWPQSKSQGYFGYDDGTIYLGMEAVAKLGPPAVVCMHCENWEIARIFEDRLLKAGRKEYKVWNERSPAFCEAGHVHAYTYYARILKCPLYIQHTTTPETIEEITRAKADGATVYAQTGPHYLSLTEDAWRINVPLRSAETIENLWQALADGRIDTVGSDHTNTGRSRKEMEVPGDIFATRTGFSSRGEAALPVMNKRRAPPNEHVLIVDWRDNINVRVMNRGEIRIVKQKDVVRKDFVFAEDFNNTLHRETGADDVMTVGFARSHNVPVGPVERSVIIMLLRCCYSAARALQGDAHFPRNLMQSM